MAAPIARGFDFKHFNRIYKTCSSIRYNRIATTTADSHIYLHNQVTETDKHEDSFEGDSSGNDFIDGYGSDHHDRLYPGHIPTTTFQKTLLSVGSAVTAITNPWRDDMIAVMGETTGQVALPVMRRKMMADPVGRQILEEQPTINTETVDLNHLRSLPEDTFGKHYVNFLDRNKVTPDTRLPVSFVDDVDLAYVMRRYREVHDLMHTLLGMPTNMQGEVAVKWVEALQTGLPMCALGAFFGPLRFGPKQRQRYFETYLWWALRNGRNAKFLMNIYYEKHWEQPIDELRAELNIEPPPIKKHKQEKT